MKIPFEICIKASEFFNHMAIGLKGKFCPFDDGQHWPELTISHTKDGKIEISNDRNGLITMNQDDTLNVNQKGHIGLIFGPARFGKNRVKAAIAATSLLSRDVEFNNTDVFIPMNGHYVIVFDANKPDGQHEQRINEVGTVVQGHDAVILFDRNDNPVKAWLRNDAQTTLAFLASCAKRKPSGAMQIFFDRGLEAFNATVAANALKSQRNTELEALTKKLEVNKPVKVMVGNKKFVVSWRKVNRGEMVSAKRADLRTLYDTGVLHEIVAQVSTH